MINKKAVLVLVIVALVLSTVSIVYNMVDGDGERVIEVNTKHIINGIMLSSRIVKLMTTFDIVIYLVLFVYTSIKIS